MVTTPSVLARSLAVALAAVVCVVAVVLTWGIRVPIAVEPALVAALIAEADLEALSGEALRAPKRATVAHGEVLAGVEVEHLLGDGAVQAHQRARICSDPVAAALRFQDWEREPPVAARFGPRAATREPADCAPFGEGCRLWWLSDEGDRRGFLVMYRRGRRLVAVSVVGATPADPAAVRAWLLPKLKALEQVEPPVWF